MNKKLIATGCVLLIVSAGMVGYGANGWQGLLTTVGMVTGVIAYGMLKTAVEQKR